MGRKKHKTKRNRVVSPPLKAPIESGRSASGLVNRWHVPPAALFLSLAVIAALTIWAYWSTLVWMEQQWRTQPDYSHGYLIVPLAVLLLYHRRDIFPRSTQVGWAGLWLLVLAVLIRVVGRVAYMDFLDGWTIVLWVGGIVWLLFGWRVFLWSLPGVVFLVLMTPLPYRAETLLSWKLQGIATSASVAALQTLGLPAVAEGHTIWLNDQQMLVEEACSGLRIFVGMGAMSFVVATLARRAWIDKAVVIMVAFPIAIFVNVLRVVGTVIAYSQLSSSLALQVHDALGIVMTIMGGLLLLAAKSYWECLYRPLDTSLDMARVVRMDGSIVGQA